MMGLLILSGLAAIVLGVLFIICVIALAFLLEKMIGNG